MMKPKDNEQIARTSIKSNMEDQNMDATQRTFFIMTFGVAIFLFGLLASWTFFAFTMGNGMVNYGMMGNTMMGSWFRGGMMGSGMTWVWLATLLSGVIAALLGWNLLKHQ